MKRNITQSFVLLLCTLTFVMGAQARDNNPVGITPTSEDAVGVGKRPSFSPYAQRGFPTQVYWGDTHVHTNNSLDARGLGVMLGPDDAYRFAIGEEVTTSHGLPFKLSRPLDWLVVADHSDGMGAMKEIIAGNPNLLKDPVGDHGFSRFVDMRGRNPHLVPFAESRGRLAALAVYAHLPGPDNPVNKGPRHTFQLCTEEIIDALSVAVRIHRYDVHASGSAVTRHFLPTH